MAVVLLAAGCANLPRDPERTLERVEGGVLRAGAVHAPPWVIVAGEAVSGREAALVEGLARELGARVEWFPGGSTRRLEAIERFELDIVIGGFTDQDPWRDRVASSRPHEEGPVRVGVAPARTPIEELDGMRVAVETGSAVAALVEKNGAVAVESEDPLGTGLPVAAPEWRLREWGLVPTGPELAVERHVFFLPPGENRWLLTVDRYVHRRAERPSRRGGHDDAGD